MAFTRKVIREFLEGAGTEGFDTEAALDKIFKEHGETVKSYKTRLEKFDDVDLDSLTSANTSLEDIKKQLNGRKIEDILAENADLTSRIAQAAKDKLVDSVLSPYKFTSESAKRDIRRQVSELELNKAGDGFVDQDKAIKAIVDANADAFVVDTPKPQFNTQGTASGAGNSTNEQDAFIAKMFGKTN